MLTHAIVDLKHLPLIISAARCAANQREGKTLGNCRQIAQASCVCSARLGKAAEEVIGQSTAADFQRSLLSLAQDLDVMKVTMIIQRTCYVFLTNLTYNITFM